MSGSKHFAQLAQKLLEDSDKGLKERQQRWRAKKLMEQLKVEDITRPPEELEAETEAQSGDQEKEELEDTDEENKAKRGKAKDDMPCACGDSCHFIIILANFSRVLWMAYEEYELLHACYADLFGEAQRPSLERKVQEYWRIFIINPEPAAPHRHAERLLRRCQVERDAHYREKASLPLDPGAPLHKSIFVRLLDPFSCVRCRCLHCKQLDAIMDYRVALFQLLAEYSDLFEDYARLFWCSEALLNSSEQEMTVKASELELKMLDLMLSELYTAMSFDGQETNVMWSLQFLRSLIYR